MTGGDNVFCGDPDNPDCVWDLTTDITDPLFRNVQWVSFCPDCTTFDFQHSVGLYDNIRFSVQVPEPAPLTLIGIALVGPAFIRRRAMSNCSKELSTLG